MKHFAKYRNEEYLLIGFAPRYNDVMLCRMAGLPGEDAGNLRAVAQSQAGQDADFLAPVLQSTRYKGNDDWFTYLMSNLPRKNGVIVRIPVTQVQEGLDPEQRKLIKGYGTNRLSKNQLLDAESEKLSESVKATKPAALKDVPTVSTPASSDYKLDMLMDTIVDEGRQTRTMLAQLIRAMNGDTSPVEEAKPERPARKTRKAA
jgi:hypothetical protein